MHVRHGFVVVLREKWFHDRHRSFFIRFRLKVWLQIHLRIERFPLLQHPSLGCFDPGLLPDTESILLRRFELSVRPFNAGAQISDYVHHRHRTHWRRHVRRPRVGPQVFSRDVIVVRSLVAAAASAPELNIQVPLGSVIIRHPASLNALDLGLRTIQLTAQPDGLFQAESLDV